MDFDEYDYLEKAVEEQDDMDLKKTKKDESERNEKSNRKRDVDDEDEDHRVKRSRSEHENGKEDRDRDRSDRGRERDRHRKDRDEDADVGKERNRTREKERDRDRDRDRDREKEIDKERDREKEKERDRDRDRDREKEKERDRERHNKDKVKERERDRERRDKERERDRDRRERERRERDKEKEREIEEERSRRSRSRSVREREGGIDIRDSRRMKEKKDVVEPEADPERDQRTVFAYQMPLKATERDVYEFFSKAGKVRDVRLIMDRNSRRSKGVGYVEFYDAMSVPMAIAISGQLLHGQPVMVKPSEAEKNLVQSNTSGGASGAGPNGAVDRKLYVGNLHFNMTETHLREIFEAFGPVEQVQLPLDLESGHCKGFGFVQFAHMEHSKAALSLNGKLEIAGRTLKVSSVTDHVGAQDSVAKSNDLDDDEGGGLALNAQSRALLMQKLDRTGIATSIAGSLGAPVLNGSAPNPRSTSLPLNGQVPVSAPVLPATFTPPVLQSVGSPSECLLLKNMFDPATETEPDFDVEIKEEVEEECSKYGRVKHIYVDKNSAGCVYLQYEAVESAINAQRAMHLRWFAGKQISVLFMQPQVYEAKFKGA